MEVLKNLIIKTGKYLYDKDLAGGTSGNISVRCENGILITASGTALGYLEQDDIVLINSDGELPKTGKKPSSEKMLHIEIYKKRPDINAIIHVHPPFCSAFAASHLELNKALLAENILYFGKIPLAPYSMPSTDKLAQETALFFADHDVVLMANHGIVAADKDLKNAFFKLETAETFARVVLYAKLLGNEKPLKDSDISELLKLKHSLHS